ncbi:M23 family metallopeptidase [Myxococcus sp. K15C18031901]|uniref:M23 family metallopeptidase n=1 Tax=Myxococcus dinghuensis TaxID=2906761 RepID=UPI0020A7F680|nr:peptidoglycan DD-metalloendopeptidase family protein [Myxococcus dinghuensis]MCP3101952.1 M23 family metallopeptidase [Myxococcus dinghuensis]
MRRLPLLAFVSVCACSGSRAEQKMSFEELYSEPEPSTYRAAAAPEHAPANPALRRAAPEPSAELQSALSTFAERSRSFRRQVARGGTMPAGQAENWELMNGLLDAFLSRAVERTDARDVSRARTVLEAELELDGRTYGDMPGALAEGVVLRVGRLAVRMAELRRLEHPEDVGGLPRLSWPVEPVTITSVFGQRWHPIMGELRRHLGVDLAAKQGQVVYTAAKGVVLRAGWNGDHGLQVEVQHDGRWLTRYSHLSRVLVEPGEVLDLGHAVGLAGETGLATGVHVHFELWRDGQALDPLDALPDEDAQRPRGPPVARSDTGS